MLLGSVMISSLASCSSPFSPNTFMMVIMMMIMTIMMMIINIMLLPVLPPTFIRGAAFPRLPPSTDPAVASFTDDGVNDDGGDNGDDQQAASLFGS